MSCFGVFLQFIVQLYYIIISSFVSKLNQKKTPNLHQEPNIGSGTFNRTSSSLDSQAVKEVPPNLLNKFNLLFLPMLNYILAYFAFFFFLKDTYFRELSLKIICYKAVTP